MPRPFFRAACVMFTVAAPLFAAVNDAAWKQVAAYKVGDKYDTMAAVEDEVARASRDRAAARPLAAKFTEILASPSATLDARAFACRQLSVIGGAADVPTLAKLLGDEKLGHYARYALQRIPGAEASQALRDATGSLRGSLRIGVINSLGERGDAPAADVLLPLLKDTDPATRLAAAQALGKIAAPSSVGALSAARVNANHSDRQRLTDALLTAADQLAARGDAKTATGIYQQLYADSAAPLAVRTAGLHGLVRLDGDNAVKRLSDVLRNDEPLRPAAARMLQAIPNRAATDALIMAIDLPDSAARLVIIESLGQRRDPVAGARVLRQVEAADAPADLRIAALRAAAQLCGAEAVETIAPHLASSEIPVRDAAREAMAQLQGENVNSKIIDTAVASSQEKLQTELLKTLPARRATDAADQLLSVAGSGGSANLRRAAFDALSELGGPDKLEPALALLVKEADASVRESAEKAVGSIAGRVADPAARVAPLAAAHRSATGSSRISLIRALGRIPSPTPAALSAVREDLNHSDAAIRDAAVRALANWPDASAGDDLKQIIRDSKDETHRILAMRGYLRLIAPPPAGAADPAGRSTRQIIQQHEDAMALCWRVDEKRSVLAGLAGIVDAAALDAVSAYEKDPKLQKEAAAAKKRIEAALEKAGKKRK